MAVFIIVVNGNLVLGCLCASFGAYCLAFRILLRNDGLYFQFAELQIGFDAEQGLASRNQRTVQRHADITGFNVLDDIIFLAFVCKFHGLLVKIERGFGVVVHVEIHLVADFAVYIELYFFIKVKNIVFPGFLSQCRVVYVIMVEPELQFCGALRFQAYASRPENLVGWPDVEFHVRDVELFFVIPFAGIVFFFPVILYGFAGGVIPVFAFRHHKRCGNVILTDPRMDDVVACCRVIFNDSVYVFRILQVERVGQIQILVRVLFELFYTDRKRIGNSFII